MNRSPFLATAILSLALAACSSSNSGTTATPTPAAAGPTGAAPTPAKGTAAGGAPSVLSIRFAPAQADGAPTVTDTIRATAATSDPDGDGVTVDWRWFINGAPVVGQLSDTLRPTPRKKHDKIEAEATPRDSRGNVGSPLRASIMIRNSTPAISSRPTGSLNGYKAVVQDADSADPNERFTWSLEAPVPPGFSLSPDGTLKFDAVAGKGAAGQKVTIVVKDSAGALAKQTFDVAF